MRISATDSVSIPRTLSTLQNGEIQSSEEFISSLDPNRDPRFKRGTSGASNHRDSDGSPKQPHLSASDSNDSSSNRRSQSGQKPRSSQFPESRRPAQIISTPRDPGEMEPMKIDNRQAIVLNNVYHENIFLKLPVREKINDSENLWNRIQIEQIHPQTDFLLKKNCHKRENKSI